MLFRSVSQSRYLPELNRQFLHPLGLALEIVVDDEGNETIGGVWDCREYLEGIHYNLEDDVERRTKFRKKIANVEAEMEKRECARREKLGFFIEPV